MGRDGTTSRNFYNQSWNQCIRGFGVRYLRGHHQWIEKDETTRKATQLGFPCVQWPTSSLGTFCLTRTYSIFFFFFYIISVKPNMLLILCMLYVWLGEDETDKWTIPPLLTLKHERLKSILHLLSSSQPFYNHLFHCKDTWERSRPVTANYTKTKQAVDHLFVCVKRSCCMPVFPFFK